MLVAQELRIGNYIQDFEDKPYFFKIESIENNNGDYWVTYNNGSINCTVDSLEPIKLTEEWLYNFGFDDKEYKSGYIGIMGKSTDFVLTKPKIMGEWQDEYCWTFDNYKFVSIKHVHQLQNLFFSLCGKELTIKN